MFVKGSKMSRGIKERDPELIEKSMLLIGFKKKAKEHAKEKRRTCRLQVFMKLLENREENHALDKNKMSKQATLTRRERFL